jgi:hypothetical protein
MDIKKASEIFTNAEHQRHFTRQVDALKIQTSTQLNDYFNIITQDPLKWMNSLPKEAQSDDALRKYKTPLNFLLNHSQVKELLGEQSCETIRKSIQKGYKNNIEQVLKQRNKTMNVNIEQHSDKDDATIDEDTDSIVDTESEPDDGLLKENEIEYKDPKTNDYQDKNIKSLEKKLQDALTDIKLLQTSLHHTKHENEFLREVLRNVTAK